ncbi:hypothetical protein F5Y08DRAFT_284750 [Xylaria arbuscula]|nr:hypothetical protein F5Y08DRAFT_284750 [Xylaria arbuscula]
MEAFSNIAPGTDLCQLPSGPVPPGESIDFTKTDLQSVANGVTITLTIFAGIFVLTRLFDNFRKPQWSDVMVFIALVANITTQVSLSMHARLLRHTWNLPFCWLTGDYPKWFYIWSILSAFSLSFSKIATLLLFLQIFTVSKAMRIAIRIGIWTTAVLYLSNIGVSTYFIVPHNGRSWDESVMDSAGKLNISTYWGIALSSAVTLIDLYIAILPIPKLWRLNMSTRKKIQITAVFFVGVIAVVASVTNLIIKILSVLRDTYTNDYTYFSAVIATLSLVEMDASLIIPCSVAFSHVMKSYVLQSGAWWEKVLSVVGINGQSKDTRQTRYCSPSWHPVVLDQSSKKRNIYRGNKDEFIELSDELLWGNVKLDVRVPEAAFLADNI